MKLSSYKFELKKNTTWNIKLKYNKTKGEMEFDLETILELRDRALLIQHTSVNDIKGKG